MIFDQNYLGSVGDLKYVVFFEFFFTHHFQNRCIKITGHDYLDFRDFWSRVLDQKLKKEISKVELFGINF